MAGRLHEDLKKEICRLGTFTSWPLSFIHPSELARYGFFYSGTADRVKCYFCGVEVGMWEQQDNVITEHLRWSSRCPLLRKRWTNNVPINPNFLDNVPDPDGDVCGSVRFVSVQHNNYTVDSQRSFQRPAHPAYAIEADRLNSFKRWPKSLHQKPQQLSDAGFIYTGSGDSVLCFSCGGELTDWEPEDEPWEQHAINHSTCEYVMLIKGPEFIQKCQQMREDEKAQTNGGQHSRPSTSGASSAASSLMSTSPVSSRSGVSSPTAPDDECTLRRCDSGLATATEDGQPGEDETGIRNISDGKICKICFVNEYNTAFLPCGHVVACAKCASSVTKCPICRHQCTKIHRVYLA